MIKKNRRKTSAYCIPRDVQQLESRQLLTGIVTYSVTPDVDISLDGDSKDNDITITLGDTFITIVGNNGTSLQFPQGLVPPGMTITQPRPPFIGDLVVKLNGGNDSLLVQIFGDVEIKGNGIVTMGAGNDSAHFETFDGAKFIVLGSVSVDMGSGDDSVRMADMELQTLGGMVLNETAEAGEQSMVTHKDIEISTGSGNDKVVLIGVEAFRDITVNSGLGHGDVLGVSNVRAGRDMNLIWGDLNAINNVTVVRKLTINSGTGDDLFAIDNLDAGMMDVNLGLGNDQLWIGDCVVVGEPAKINGGAGKNDNFKSLSPTNGWSVKGFEGGVVDLNSMAWTTMFMKLGVGYNFWYA